MTGVDVRTRMHDWGRVAAALCGLTVLGCPGTYPSAAPPDDGGAGAGGGGAAAVELEWTTVGGPAEGSPAICSWGEGRLDVFWLEAFTGAIVHSVRPTLDAGWIVEDEPVAENATHSPTCVSSQKHLIDVFWRGGDGQLLRRRLYLDEWFPTKEIIAESGSNPTLESSPDAASWGPGRTDVFWRAEAGGLGHAKGLAFGWTTKLLPAEVASEPTAVSWGYPRLDVVYRTHAGALGHTRYDADAAELWTHSIVAGATALGFKPAVASMVAGRLDVFWRGSNDGLMHQSFTDPDLWSEVEDLGGGVTSGPDAVARLHDAVDIVAARGPENTVQHATWVREP